MDPLDQLEPGEGQPEEPAPPGEDRHMSEFGTDDESERPDPAERATTDRPDAPTDSPLAQPHDMPAVDQGDRPTMSHDGPDRRDVPYAPPETATVMERSATDARRVEIDLVEGDFRIHGGSADVVLRLPGEHDKTLIGADELERAAGRAVALDDLPDGAVLLVPDGVEVGIRRIQGDLRADHAGALLRVRRVDGDVSLDGVAFAELADVSGDLDAVHGAGIAVETVAGDAHVSDYTDAVVLDSVDGDVRVRDAAQVAFSKCIGGDCATEHCGPVSFSVVSGDLHVVECGSVRGRSVGGDSVIENVDDVALSTVEGDLRLNMVRGAVTVRAVLGDAKVVDASQSIRLGTVGGDLRCHGVTHGVQVARIGGDCELDTALGSGTDFAVHAAGDIALRVRGEINARFVAQSRGGEVRTRLPLTVERGRRRNLVGMLGDGSATVTLQSDGGDILITGTDRHERERRGMSDDNTEDRDTESTQRDAADSRTWEGSFAGRKFRVQWDRGADHGGVRFQGPVAEGEQTEGNRDFGVEWERGNSPRAYGEYEERLRELGDRAEKLARRTAEQAQHYAERAAKRARETDWESVGREVRGAIEKAMADLEDAFGNLRGEWESRRPGGEESAAPRPTAQRVRIEHDDEPVAATSSATSDTAADIEAQRRDILEQLRTGAISVDEAERRLNSLR